MALYCTPLVSGVLHFPDRPTPLSPGHSLTGLGFGPGLRLAAVSVRLRCHADADWLQAGAVYGRMVARFVNAGAK